MTEAIEFAVQRLVIAAHAPLKVILFGSYARGDADAGSDVDLLVVEREILTPQRNTSNSIGLHRKRVLAWTCCS